MRCDYLVVGAGLFGSVLAERIANDLKASVIVIDKRPHIGGNCYSETDPATGIEFHKYGTHIFHTSSEKAWRYISRFTAFNGYHHQVLASHQGRLYQMPINLATINAFYGASWCPAEAREFLRGEIARENIKEPRNLEEQALAAMGRPLYEAFVKSYTLKHWQIDPKDLPADIITRLPVRFDFDTTYFKSGRWQGIPLHGYTAMFGRMLASPRIRVVLDRDYLEDQQEFQPSRKTIYSGPLDRLFGYRLGRLQWRSIGLEGTVLDVQDHQGVAVVNYPDPDVPYTRVHEPRHLHPERTYPRDRTLIFTERPRDGRDDPSYPVRTRADVALYEGYAEMARARGDLIVGGRLGKYAYLNMDQAILSALRCYEQEIVPSWTGRPSPEDFESDTVLVA